MKPRVGLFLSKDPSGGGVYQWSQSVLRAFAALPASEFERIVVTTDASWTDQATALDLRVQETTIRWIDRVTSGLWLLLGLPVGLWRATLGRWLPLPRALVRQRCDLLIFPGQERWAFLTPARSVGVILDLMHRYQRQFPEVSAGFEYRRRENLYRNMCRWAVAVLVDSECGRVQAGESYGMALERLLPLPLVVPPGVLLSTRQAVDVKRRYQLPEKYLVYPAQFWPHKNHARLIRAIALARVRHPDIALVLTGAHSREYPSLARLVEDLGLQESVRFPGYVETEDLAAMVRGARALIMPTFFGPTNTPPMEAMALGCPVAVSNLYAMPEQVGDAGLTFDPESVPELQAVVERLWDDDALCLELTRRGKERIKAWGEPEFAHTFAQHVRTALQLDRA